MLDDCVTGRLPGPLVDVTTSSVAATVWIGGECLHTRPRMAGPRQPLTTARPHQRRRPLSIEPRDGSAEDVDLPTSVRVHDVRTGRLAASRRVLWASVPASCLELHCRGYGCTSGSAARPRRDLGFHLRHLAQRSAPGEGPRHRRSGHRRPDEGLQRRAGFAREARQGRLRRPSRTALAARGRDRPPARRTPARRRIRGAPRGQPDRRERPDPRPDHLQPDVAHPGPLDLSGPDRRRTRRGWHRGHRPATRRKADCRPRHGAAALTSTRRAAACGTDPTHRGARPTPAERQSLAAR